VVSRTKVLKAFLDLSARLPKAIGRYYGTSGVRSGGGARQDQDDYQGKIANACSDF
jgi:hypothetical protein